MIQNSNSNQKKIAVIITAAGSSTRMGGSVKKEYMPLNGGTVLSNCIQAFSDASKIPQHEFNISNLLITVPVDGTLAAAEAVTAFFAFDDEIQEKVEYVQGGYTRQRSVYNALITLEKHNQHPDYVIIHDGARPFVTNQIIHDAIEAAEEYGAAVPGITPTDTIKEINADGLIVRHLERKNLICVQTPQAFKFDQLLIAHKKAVSDGHEYTDDSEIWGKYCGFVRVVPGDIKNKKITYPGDLESEKK